MKHTLYITVFALTILSILYGCQPQAMNENDLFYTEAQVTDLTKDGHIYTLNELVSTYMTEKGNYMSDTTLYRTRANNESKNPGIWLFSIDTLPSTGEGIYIRGRVISDDFGGNFYKALVIQQVVNNQQQALRLSIDAGSISGLYPKGQEILIRCNGLAIGRYANQVQLCVPSFNNNKWANNADQKVGWTPGRIPLARFKKATYRIGQPDTSKLHVDVLTIRDMTASYDIKAARTKDGCLVRIEGVHWTGQYEYNGSLNDCTTGNPATDTYANVFAPTTGNVGYPQSRVISDGSGTTQVSVSEYAKQANFYLPGANAEGVAHCSEYVGSVTGILSYYMDNANYEPDAYNWSISIRDLRDVRLQHTQTQEYWFPDNAHEYTTLP